MKRLLEFSWIMPSRSSRVQRRVSALFVAADLPAPEPAVEAESMAFLLQMLKDSDALTYTVHTSLLSAEGAGLTMLNVPQLRASREAGVIARRGVWLSPAANAIINELKKICASAPQG
jgi:LysR family transcriptional regulator of gallate degradation